MSRPLKHGFRYHPLYGRWCDIKKRCYNQNCKAYKNYGGRGITMCDAWLNDAGAFIRWCELNGFKDGLTIDRIDNDKGYSPENCRFVTFSENSKHRRPNRRRPKNPYSFKKSGLPIGVQRSGNKFMAMASFNNKYKYFGSYETVEDANRAYQNGISANN